MFSQRNIKPVNWWLSTSKTSRWSGAYVIVGEGQDTWATMVREVHKHMIVGTAAKEKRAKLVRE